MSNSALRLRALEPTDIDLLYAWENDAATWAATNTIAPFSRHMLWQYLENYTGDIYVSHELRLMIENADGQAVGTVDLLNFDPLNNRAELGLFISEEFRGQGIGRPALDAIIDYALNHIGLRQLYIYVREDNAACLKLFDNYGFTRVGILRQWVKRGTQYYDAVLLQQLL